MSQTVARARGTSDEHPSTPGGGDPTPEPMSHRAILSALSGLLLAMFVAMLSSTIVSNALPRIVADLRGSQSGYTWVVVATLLTMTATTPIWGKLADQFSKKLLVQVSLVIFLAGSVLAGFATSMGMLIGARAVQGLGVGGLSALVQVVIATMVSPRERGRYSGYIGATFALATVSGPLIGGLIVDSIGWRWCFFVGIPVAAVAFVVLQRTLHLPLPDPARRPRIDVAGATLLVGGVSVLLVWVSLAGKSYDWLSGWTAGLVAAGLVLLAAATYVEARVAVEPIIPLRLFRDRTTSLATAASVMVGIAMFGATVYLAQYFQLAKAMSPTRAGLMTIALVGGLFVSSLSTGRIISRTGRWKRYLVGGTTLLVVGLALLSRIDAGTPLLYTGVAMAVMGVGLGATMQNLVLAVQNNTRQADMGAASSVVSFFRSLGGSIGVSVLGAVLSSQVASTVSEKLAAAGTPAGGGASSSSIPDLGSLPAPVRAIFEGAFGQAAGHLFGIAVPFAVLALICVLFIKEVPLRTTIDVEDELSLGLEPQDVTGERAVARREHADAPSAER